MHENSLSAYGEERPNLNKRCKAVMSAVDDLGVATDRAIKEYLKLPDMNNVRPRVTELIKLGLLREFDTTKCELTNKSVRRVKLAQPNKQQLELF